MSTRKESVLQALDLAGYKHNLYSVKDSYADKLLEYYRMQANRVNADYFYCFNNLIENRPVPYIYIYDRHECNNKDTINLVEINKQLWTLGEIALAVIIYEDGFKILDTRNPIKSVKKKPEPSFLDGISVIREIDSCLKKRIFEGRILEESPADYISVSPYQKLLDHIEKYVLNKNKQIGCELELLKKLLVKFILIKYLEEQVDHNGNSVFDSGFFKKFIVDKESNTTLFDKEYTFCDVLRGNDIVGLLSALNVKFNGGIFKISPKEEMEIKAIDFHIIADALDGNKDFDGQISIWRYYDFNLLPIEFISRLYERFVTSVDGKQKSTGAFYTPPHLARLLIDELLPFNKEIDFENFKILDPSCGSGIFLVLAYKRLITLWMLNNNKQIIEGEEDIKEIKKILSKCIYGVDINKDALSITATSLQIELSSHIRPKEIWEKLTFDNLVEHGNLVNQGFFKWYKRTSLRFDIIAGNPPFNISKKEQLKNIEAGIDDEFFSEKYNDYVGKLCPFPNKNPALIFLYRCLNNLLLENEGVVFMIMPSSTFLYMPSSIRYRKSLIHYWNIEKIYDFTPLMDRLWGNINIATIAVKISNGCFVRNSVIEHIVIRNSSANEKGAIRFQIDQYDRYRVPVDVAFSKDYTWKTNLLGGGYLKQLMEKYEIQYPKIAQIFKGKGNGGGYQRDKSTIDDIKLREEGKRVVDLNGRRVMDSKLFNCDIYTDGMTKIISKKDWVRIPEYISTPPNVLLRLNLNLNLPIIYNEQNILFPKGILGLKDESEELMKKFVSVFKENRWLYAFLIKVMSAKAFVQQSDAYTVDARDILRLPINTDEKGYPVSFGQMDRLDCMIIEDTMLLANNLNNSDPVIFKGIDAGLLDKYCDVFCDILNRTYGKEGYGFKSVRQIITDDYVWVTFEHTNQPAGTVEDDITGRNESILSEILYDNISNNALTINRIITCYKIDNQINFIKPNKLKYWMRTIAYRDAENVKSDMFKNGY